LLTISDLKTYVPCLDFEASKQFYRELGFELTEGYGGTFDCKLGAAQFRLQNYYVKDWADNFMMLLQVDDVNAWYQRAKLLVESNRFDKVRITEVEERDGALITNLIDPGGVLLIFIQILA
jgi:hypothetical protein